MSTGISASSGKIPSSPNLACLASSRRSRLTPIVRATALLRSVSLRASNATKPLLSSRLFTSAIARSRACFLAIRSRRNALTSFKSPLAKTGGKSAKLRKEGHDLLLWQAAGEECLSLVLLHRVHGLLDGVGGQDVVEPRGNQARCAGSGPKERVQVRIAPGIVDNQQDAAFAQSPAELGGSGGDVLESGSVIGEDFDQIRND